MEKGRIVKWTLVACVVLAAAAGLSRWYARRAHVADNRAELARLGLPGDGTSDFMPLPAILPHVAPAARLGGALFSDRRLAQASRRTCSSCHWMNMGGSDGKLHGGWLTRPFVNAAAAKVFLHDGSLTNITDAIARMITDGTYAGGGSLDTVVARLAEDKELAAAFARVYKPGLDATTLKDALEQYARTQLSAGRPFDRYQGGEAAALTDSARHGFELFRTRRCLACHAGPMMGGLGTHEGRKIPPLRGLGARTRFLADGSAENLDVVLMRMPAGEMTPEERMAFIAFLRAL